MVNRRLGLMSPDVIQRKTEYERKGDESKEGSERRSLFLRLARLEALPRFREGLFFGLGLEWPVEGEFDRFRLRGAMCVRLIVQVNVRPREKSTKPNTGMSHQPKVKICRQGTGANA